MFHYLVTSYTESDQLYRLLALIRRQSPHAQIVVSHDRKSLPLDPATLEQWDVGYHRTTRDITWGDASYLQSVLENIRASQLRASDWLTILTGQDYLLRPLMEYERHLVATDADALLELGDRADPHEAVLLRRYRRRFFDVAPPIDRHLLARIVNQVPGLEYLHQPRGAPSRISVPRLRTPFDDAFQLYRGADLYAINGRAAQALIHAPKDLMQYYRHSSVPSESFPHTVLRNNHALSCREEALHFTQWKLAAHPEWLGHQDLSAMVASGRWFARKFLPGDPVLDELDTLLSK